MSTSAFKISEFMTKSPHLIGMEQSLATAHAVMRKKKIRHLPVLHAGKVVGLVSQGDLHWVETLPDVDLDQVTVEEAMSRDVYGVREDATLRSVVREMARRKLGSAIVMKGSKVAGIFTTIDALTALEQLLG